jgi:LruC domain-containing protein
MTSKQVRAGLTLTGLLGLSLLSGAPSARAQTWYPGQSTTSVLAFEDQWPHATDYDYNDVVIEVHWRFDSSGGKVQRALLTVDPLALGGDHTNGLGLQLPAGVSQEGLLVRRRVGSGGDPSTAPTYGEWADLQLAADGAPTVVLASNLRELFDGESGRINVGLPGANGRVGQRLEVEFNWPVGAALDVAQAPFDLYIFRTLSPSHEIHLPHYQGTDAMDDALFAVADNATPPAGTRWFVNARGIPAALNLKTAVVHTSEAVSISDVFPDIVRFAALPNLASWSGTGDDPRTFYERPTGPGARHTRPASRLRPEAPALSRITCPLSGNRVGRRVRADRACVFSECEAGYSAMPDGSCVNACGAAPNPPAPAECPAACTGGCVGNTCSINSFGSGQTVCPGGMHCVIGCTNTSNCQGRVLSCPDNGDCTLRCTGASACQSAVVFPGAGAGRIDLDCGGPSACQGLMLQCGAGPCLSTCGGASAGSGGILVPGNSCQVSNGCNLPVSACGLLPNPPAPAQCPAACNGGCSGNTCRIDVFSGSPALVCPDGLNCLVRCLGSSSCQDAAVFCPDHGSCSLQCSGPSSCQGADLLPGAGAGSIDLSCPGPGSCQAVDQQCGAGPCSCTFMHAGQGGRLFAGSSCRVSNACGLTLQ